MKKSLILMLLVCSMTASAQLKKETYQEEFFTKDSILNGFILKWLGKPYKLGGNSERGIDCSTFNKRLYKEVFNKDLQNVCYKQWNQTGRIKRDSLIMGDLLFFRSKQSPSGWHCGVYLGNTYFIHAANKYEGVKISSLSEPRYQKNFKGGGRL